MDTQITTTRPDPTPADRPPIVAMPPPPGCNLNEWYGGADAAEAEAEREMREADEASWRDYRELAAEAEADMRAHETASWRGYCGDVSAALAGMRAAETAPAAA